MALPDMAQKQIEPPAYGCPIQYLSRHDEEAARTAAPVEMARKRRIHLLGLCTTDLCSD